ncbi:MAG TPA: hypothetical protein VFZ72_02605, partial [Jiangellaceae bacterium]
VVESDRAQLGEIVQRVRDGRLRTNIGTVATLDDAVAAFNPTERIRGKTIIRKDSATASGAAFLVDQRQPRGQVGRLVPEDVIGAGLTPGGPAQVRPRP